MNYDYDYSEPERNDRMPASTAGVREDPQRRAQAGLSSVERALNMLNDSPARQQALFQLATAIMWFNKAYQDSEHIQKHREQAQIEEKQRQEEHAAAARKQAERDALIDAVLYEVSTKLTIVHGEAVVTPPDAEPASDVVARARGSIKPKP